MLAQTAEVRRNSNLRSEPSVRLAPLRLVTPGERVELASGEYRNGYYRVRTALPEEGWLWARNVRILSVSPGRSTTAYVLQPSNLRPVPSTSESPLGIIEPGSEVTILESQSVQGYFKVRTRSGEEGWLWAQNLGLYAPRRTIRAARKCGGTAYRAANRHGLSHPDVDAPRSPGTALRRCCTGVGCFAVWCERRSFRPKARSSARPHPCGSRPRSPGKAAGRP